MSRFHKVLGSIAALGLAASVSARPIHVVVLEVIDPGGYLHSSIHNGTPFMIDVLNNVNGQTQGHKMTDSTLGTGVVPLVPPEGFLVDTIGNGGNGSSGGGATAANVAKLDSLLTKGNVDVLWEQNSLGFGGIIPASDAQFRADFLKFADTKGIVADHSAADNHSSSSSAPTWTQYDSLTGVQFLNHVTGSVNELEDTIPLDTNDAANFKPLYSGLKSKNSFTEELYSMTANPRPIAGIRVLTTLDEKSYSTPPTTKYGDHPYNWYRISQNVGHTGRWYYTCEGHIDSMFQNNYAYRRLLYNAIVWAAGYTDYNACASYNGVGGDTTTGSVCGTAILNHATPNFSANISKTSITGASLTVSFLKEGIHSIEIRGLDGKLIASDYGQGMSHTFNLRPNSVYAVFASTPQGRQSKIVTTQE